MVSSTQNWKFSLGISLRDAEHGGSNPFQNFSFEPMS